MAIEFYAPIRIHSEPNTRGSWKGRHFGRRNMHHRNVWAELKSRQVVLPWPARVTMTRLYPPANGKPIKDDDNLKPGFKFVRDAIAEYAGHDDGDPGWIWIHEQRVNDRNPREYAVLVRIEESDHV